MERNKIIPPEKIGDVLDEMFALSDWDQSDDNNESDEHDNDAVFIEQECLNQELLDVLESGPSSSHNINILTESLSILSPTSSENTVHVNREHSTESEERFDSDDSEIVLSTLQTRIRSQPNYVSDTDIEDNDTTWKKVRFHHKPPTDQFDSVQIKASQFFSSRSSPGAYFKFLFPEEIIVHIVEQTNLYALQEKRKDWDPVTVPELKAFLGILVLMSVHPLPVIDLYWSTDPLFFVSEIANVMTSKRFKKILRNLHINDNTRMPKKGDDGYDKLYKIRPLIDSLGKTFQNCANNSSSQSIDESMIKFKGRCSLKQYMPKKPIKRGFKVWARCDSRTGYLYEFEIYTGKKGETAEAGLGASVVKRLCQSLINENIKPVHVCFDNFFASSELLQFLFEKNIYSTATVRSDRTNLPNRIRTKRQKKGEPKPKKLKLEKGQYKWRVNSNVGCFVWMDTKPVFILSTAYDPRSKTVCNRTQKDGSKQEIACPIGVIEYTKRMGGVDRFDQKRGTYPMARRSRRWWMRIFYFLVDAAITNAYILYAENSRVHRSMTMLQFRTILGRNMVNNFTTRKRASNRPTFVTKKPKHNSRQKEIFGVPDQLRLNEVGTHMPGELPTYRRCRACSTKSLSKKSKIQCTKCGVALCIVPCFADFHKS